MLSNAQAVFDRFVVPAEIPPNGTGPLGAPGGGGRRWITRDDVIVWNCGTTTIPASLRSTYTDQLHRRRYTQYPNNLRDYQWEAVRSCNPEPGIFRSCIVNMECGTGKTWVASELIRRSGSTSVVLAQHTVSVTQFVAHIQTTLGIRAVTLTDDNVRDVDSYDVVVTTYNRLARVVNMVDQHRKQIVEGTHSSSYYVGDRFLMNSMCEPFGLLIMDEVHTLVADKFMCACRMLAHAVIGFSGSLIREDNRIDSLPMVVGPVVYTYGRTDREHVVHVHRVPMEDARVRDAGTRTALHQTTRALNPYKVERLFHILGQCSDKRVIVFCDTIRPTEILRTTVLAGRCLLLNGTVSSRDSRDEIIRVFSASPPGSLVLLCTKVCDVSIDFPNGCVLVEYHLTTGSRQQEMQRCGRGTRGHDGATVHHIVNKDTEEERFSDRRIQHLTEEMWGHIDVRRYDVTTGLSENCWSPLESLVRIKIDIGKSKVAKRPRNDRRLLVHKKS